MFAKIIYEKAYKWENLMSIHNISLIIGGDFNVHNFILYDFVVSRKGD